MRKIAGNRRILAGSSQGRKVLAALVESSPAGNEPEVVFIDFAGVDYVTSSFIRESLASYRDFARANLGNVYPILANANEEVAEEIEFFARERGDVFWMCSLDSEGNATGGRLIGTLDPAQRSTFEIVARMGAASAPELASLFRDLGVGATAWNNRLSALCSKGILKERRKGKTKFFSLALEENNGS
ncbi:MAG: hypothetical protein WD341_12450 [Tistlia sp.]|uniref:hypothetical protein n=1 Tax=Tistlia sp. TaxID=3057121 RepID=UPI0034A3F3C4